MNSISFNTAIGNLKKSNGYGVASYNIITSLQRMGIKVPFDDPKPPVQLNFCQPMWFHLRKNQYQIGYTPWESTTLPDDWLDTFKQCDEVWTPTKWCKDVFENNGLKDVKVYRHGIESFWKVPTLRQPHDKLRFLHIGSPAARKSGQLTVDAFIKAFNKKDNVSLTLKCSGYTEARHKDNAGNILGPLENLGNVKIIRHELDDDEMLNLYLTHDVMVYPSMGEGFGLIPIQALATGMPSIVTEAWCDYDRYIIPLGSQLIDSPWPVMHPGKVYQPKLDDLVEFMRMVYEKFSYFAESAYKNTDDLYLEFDWDTLTQEAFKELLEKF